MRADAHVDVVALLIEGDDGVIGQVGNVLDLVDFTAVLHELDSLIAGQGIDLEGQVFLHDLLHFRLDGGQVFICEFDVAQIDVIMESLFSGGTIGKVGIGVQALDRLGHDMSGRVTEHLQLIFRGTFRDMTVVVDDFHGIPSFFPGVCVQKSIRPAFLCRDGC